MNATARIRLAFALLGACLVAGHLVAQQQSPEKPTRRELAARGLKTAHVVRIAAGAPASTLHVPVTLDDGTEGILELKRTSTRRPHFRVYSAGSSGLEEKAPAPSRTYRGVFRVGGAVRGRVAASLLEDGLRARILADDGRDILIEPADVTGDRHVVYSSTDVVPDTPRVCGAEGLEAVLDRSSSTPEVRRAAPPGPGEVKVAEVAVDVDYEYYLLYGSVAAVQTRVETLINLVNVQYERDVAIRLELSALVVRQNVNDPYTSSDPGTLLDELSTEWINNQGGIQRDIVHLFTGRDLNGNTIGVAYLGTVCNQFFNFGLSQVDFSASITSSTDLIAHEVGHNFNADHCSCPSHTMNPSITSSNQFHSTLTIPTIESFRDSLGCLATEPLEDNTPPSVTIDAPYDGQLVSGSVDIDVTATDESGIAQVEFFLDASPTPFATDTTAPYTTNLDTSAMVDGTYTITVVATDASANANTSNAQVDFEVMQTPMADPGFPYADSDGNGVFELASGDQQVDVSLLADGFFDTRKGEGNYAGSLDADLVVPSSVGTINSSSTKGIILLADGDLTVQASLVASAERGSIKLISRTGGIVLGEPAAPTITLDAPRVVVVVAKRGSIVADSVDATGLKIVLKAGTMVDLDSGQMTGDAAVVVRTRGDGSLMLNNYDLLTTAAKAKVVVKSGDVDLTGAELNALKVVVKSVTTLDAQNSQLLACASVSGQVVCAAKNSTNLSGSTLLAGKRVTLKVESSDLTNATIANSQSEGRVVIKATTTVHVEGATLLGGIDDPLVVGTVTGTPLVMGSGTSVCP